MTEPAEQARLWRAHAEEIRTVAETMKYQPARDDLFEVAENWDRMANRADERAQRSK